MVFLKPIFLGQEPMNVVIFGSGSGIVFKGLIEEQKKYKSNFVIKAAFSNKKCEFQKIAEEAQLPHFYLSFSKFKHDFFDKSLARYSYDEKIVRLLEEYQERQGFRIDLIILAGYMQILSQPLLSYFYNRIINIHPADLTILNEKGERKYTGTDQIAQALKCGEQKTRTTVHLVKEGADTGPILVLGPSINWEGKSLTESEITKHQIKQKLQSDLLACITAILLISRGRLKLDEKSQVYLDEKKISSGYDLDLALSDNI